MFIIGLWNIRNTNILEMRKIEYEIINGEMYEIVRRISVEKFKQSELGMEDVQLLK